jgi:CxxC-x17-CxxC domain-containing protein
MYNDRTLTCADCGQEFAFSATEQAFYADRGFTDPRRCPSCRAARKSARGDDAGGSSYSSGGGGGRSSYGSDRGPREMFPATCSSCGKPTQVPFKPTSGKPVYCSDCFRQR